MLSLMYVKKFASFCQALKKVADKRKSVPFFLPQGVVPIAEQNRLQTWSSTSALCRAKMLHIVSSRLETPI